MAEQGVLGGRAPPIPIRCPSPAQQKAWRQEGWMPPAHPLCALPSLAPSSSETQMPATCPHAWQTGASRTRLGLPTLCCPSHCHLCPQAAAVAAKLCQLPGDLRLRADGAPRAGHGALRVGGAHGSALLGQSAEAGRTAPAQGPPGASATHQPPPSVLVNPTAGHLLSLGA